ncbi:MAG: hypothetical protein GPJ18_25710 [Microcystis aeruginosa F13-15]|nr:hypothetical protein [Microcystis aeruginosa F13-15]
MRKILRERSRNLNREVWESPSVYGGEDVNSSPAKIKNLTLGKETGDSETGGEKRQ